MELPLFDENEKPSPDAGYPINDAVVKSFVVAKAFNLNRDMVNNIDFSRDGSLFLTSSYDDQINVYHSESGTHKRTCFSKKYGVNLATFTHTPTSIVYASTKLGHDLRYLSLHDNKFIRYFSGHTEKVTGLSMSPVDDFFISMSSTDKTIRLWNLKDPDCAGLMYLNSQGVATFDPEGLVFAVATTHQIVKLFDMRTYDKGPFCTFQLPPRGGVGYKLCSLTFSPNGKQLLINSNGPELHLIDAFTGDLIWQLEGREEFPLQERVELDAVFTPDSKYIFSASANGKVHVWRVSDGRHLAVLNPKQKDAVRCLKFSPIHMLMVTACVDTALWIPRITEEEMGKEEFKTESKGYIPF